MVGGLGNSAKRIEEATSDLLIVERAATREIA